ncbi:MAG TPA: hypothetical protein VM889_09940 [Candidatus Thermoplasmatota archaeon]|nr:hypothetical protein [Candidatus Thermoplasmatota archaeon]
MAGKGAFRTVLVLALAIAFLPLGAIAAPTVPLDPEPSPGFQFLSPAVFARMSDVDSEACGNGEKTAIRSLTPELPRAADSAKVYSGPNLVTLACPFRFNATVEKPFRLDQGISFTTWLLCSRPSPYFRMSDVPTFEDYRFQLMKNGKIVAKSAGKFSSFLQVCNDIFVKPVRIDFNANITDVTFAAGDMLQANVVFFGAPDAGNSLYLLMAGRDHPSALYGVGLPGLRRVNPTSDLVVDMPEAILEVGPGNATSHTLTIENVASVPRLVKVVVNNGPPGWTAWSDPAAVTIAPNGSASVAVTIAAPLTARWAEVATHRVVFRTSEEAGAVDITTEVEPGKGDIAPWMQPKPRDDNLTILTPASSPASEPSTLLGLLKELSTEIIATAITAGIATAIALWRKSKSAA